MKNEHKKHEKQVREKLILWLQREHPDWSISNEPIKISVFEEKTLFGRERISPDIDVLAYCEASDKLISFEIKSPTYRCREYYVLKEGGKVVGWQPYKGNLGKLSSEKYKIERSPCPHKPDPKIIYKGIGQALFNLRYVDQSFLVLPNYFHLFLPFHQIFLNILLDGSLPLGLVEYEFSFHQGEKLKVKGFKENCKAKSLYLWRNYGKVLKEKTVGVSAWEAQAIRMYLKEKTKNSQTT